MVGDGPIEQRLLLGGRRDDLRLVDVDPVLLAQVRDGQRQRSGRVGCGFARSGVPRIRALMRDHHDVRSVMVGVSGAPRRAVVARSIHRRTRGRHAGRWWRRPAHAGRREADRPGAAGRVDRRGRASVGWVPAGNTTRLRAGGAASGSEGRADTDGAGPAAGAGLSAGARLPAGAGLDGTDAGAGVTGASMGGRPRAAATDAATDARIRRSRARTSRTVAATDARTSADRLRTVRAVVAAAAPAADRMRRTDRAAAATAAPMAARLRRAAAAILTHAARPATTARRPATMTRIAGMTITGATRRTTHTAPPDAPLARRR